MDATNSVRVKTWEQAERWKNDFTWFSDKHWGRAKAETTHPLSPLHLGGSLDSLLMHFLDCTEDIRKNLSGQWPCVWPGTFSPWGDNAVHKINSIHQTLFMSGVQFKAHQATVPPPAKWPFINNYVRMGLLSIETSEVFIYLLCASSFTPFLLVLHWFHCYFVLRDPPPLNRKWDTVTPWEHCDEATGD